MDRHANKTAQAMSPTHAHDRLILIDAIDAALPQTQCGKCGQSGCRPYAEAVADGAPINRCPPGGEATLARLSALTGQAITALESPAQSPLTAYIRESECIGCTKCIQACPVDAILGAAKQMHTVITDQCTGCELCVAPCPVDCIDLLPHPTWVAAESEQAQNQYLRHRQQIGRARHQARHRRLDREARQKRRERQRRKRLASAPHSLQQGPRQAPSRLGIKAAEHALRRARQQLAHAERQGSFEDIQIAKDHLAAAQRLLEDAQVNTPHSTTAPPFS